MTNRTVLEIELTPVAGSRFQPTGFPDLGPAVFDVPDPDGGWTRGLLVESAQSMANRLEATTWDAAAGEQVPELAGVPYVRIVDEQGAYLTSSRVEAHRLASVYVRTGTIDGRPGEDVLRERLGLVAGRPLDLTGVHRAVFALDPGCLVHGVFFSQGKGWPWFPKVARAVTCFVEAHDVREAVSGGVKKDSVSNTAVEGAGSSEGVGMVPYHRTEWVAQRVVAYVSVDHAQIRSYGLGEAGTELIEALVGFELSRVFADGLRLRTACDLAVRDVIGGELPEAGAAAKRVADAVAACGDTLGRVVSVTAPARKAAKKAATAPATEDA